MATAATNPNLENRREINILLLSETGVGKSTFVNSLVNYLQFNTFNEACESIQHLRCVIPTKFIITDDQFNEKAIEFGSSDNESTTTGASATLKAVTYKIELPESNLVLRIIDTPGVGDTRGIEQDDLNKKNVIHLLASVPYVNAICILLKSNQARCTIAFQYCINQLLLYLHKNAVEKIMFIFTNTSTSFFTPGETIHSLKKILEDIELKQNIVIPLSKENIFCIDNESFRYLLAKRSGVKLGKETIFEKSFAHSRGEYMRLIDAAKSSIPYMLNNILYLYVTRQKFEEFCHLLTTKSNVLKNDSVLLKKMHSIIEDSDSTEDEDRRCQINEIESRMSKNEHEKDNLILQISKFVIFLQTNSILLFNDYCIEYVNYLIDQEMSKGFLTDNNSIKNYRNMINYHENIKKVIEMDIHVDPFSLLMSRDELSSFYPQLEDEFNKINTVYNDEVLISVNKVTKQENPVKEESSFFNFDKWCNILQESVLPIVNNAEKAYDYEELRKTFVKQGHANVKTKKSVNDNLNNQNSKSGMYNRKTPFNNNGKNGESSKPQNERHRNRRNNKFSNNDIKLNTKSRSLCFLDQLDAGSEENHDFVHVNESKDDFVFLTSDTPQNRNRGAFHGRGRSRGRGRGRGRGNANVQSNEQPHKQKNVNPNMQKHSNRGNQRNPSSTSRTNNSREEYGALPKNVLQSMKNMFD